MARSGAGPGAGTAVLLAVIAVTVGWLAFSAATDAPHVSIVGRIVGPCDAAPSSSVDVRVDGEIVGSGAVGQWESMGRLCGASVSVNDVESHDVYTLDTGELSGTVTQSALHDMITIRMWRDT